MDSAAQRFDCASIMDVTRASCNPIYLPVDMTPEDWFEGGKARFALAIEICDGCPLKWECRSEARARKEEHGIFGGETPEQRHQYLYPPPMVAIGRCDTHGTQKDIYLHPTKRTIVQYCAQCRSELSRAALPRETHCRRHGTKKVTHNDSRKPSGIVMRCPDCAREASAAGRARRKAMGLTTAGKPRRRGAAA